MEQGCIRQIYGAEDENCKDKKKNKGNWAKNHIKKI